ncbi:efflux RND transporter periplasmic adaptor subunit [Patescibacteria group bacterium]|nr:efflux RND transporter periplasmic adaptor subunit [Patescibacteria group bacterium]
MFKKKWFILTLIVVVIVVISMFFNKGGKESPYVTAKAVVQDIKQTVEVTGQVESADDIDLNFLRSGIIANVNTSVGQKVKAGQVLASLRAGDAASQVADARASVAIAESNLKELLAGLSTEDLVVLREEVDAAEVAYQTTQDALVDLEDTRDQEMANLIASGNNILNDKPSIAHYALDIVEEAIISSDAEYYLYVLNQSTFLDARIKYHTAKDSLDNFLATFDPAANADKAVLLNSLDSLADVLNDALISVNAAFDTMLVTIENSTYTATVIAGYKTSFNTQNTTLSTAITSIQTASNNLRSKEIYYQTQLNAANNSIASALSSLNLSKAKLASKEAPPRDFEIASAEANVRRAQATLNRYLSDFSETVIKAPVDGTITKVNFNAGENSSASQPVISMIGESKLQIEVNVPESDITKIAVADNVEIILDAFSSLEKFFGVVTFIDPASTIINGVTYYNVKVDFNEPQDKIKSGMTADLTIFTDEKTGVLVVPSRSIVIRDGVQYVQILQGETLVERQVTAGLKSDDGVTEIISGVSEGEDIITLVKE